MGLRQLLLLVGSLLLLLPDGLAQTLFGSSSQANTSPLPLVSGSEAAGSSMADAALLTQAVDAVIQLQGPDAVPFSKYKALVVQGSLRRVLAGWSSLNLTLQSFQVSQAQPSCLIVKQKQGAVLLAHHHSSVCPQI